ncbi:MAG: restriction endonuclease subunit S [Treponema sp.]|uniref:restriction endonuclease subunit S n=1 Tax=Treponema sp. TaxID=166 RepID=UPI002A91C471|nr:restriction endonuclease subunit S [Treponema sp.]MDY6397636.1 restriction endonuclease subunit S [Treponema sp.]
MAQIKKDTSLRKAILQAAITGQLISTCHSELDSESAETGKELLDRIIEERNKKLLAEWEEALKKNPKAKKPVPVVASVIDEEEIPFEIPENWCWCRLGDLAFIARGGSPRPINEYLTNDPDGYNWIKISDTDKGGKYINSTKQKIKKEGLYKTRLIHKGDFLLTNSMSFGRPYISNIEGCIHDGWLVFSFSNECISPDFIYHLLSSSFIYNQFADSAAGAVVQNLNTDKVIETLIPLPPLSVQKAIVVKLEKVLPLVDAYENALLQKEELKNALPDKVKKAILQEAITGQLTENWRKSATIKESGKQLLDRIIEERNAKALAEWEESLKKNPKAKKPVPVVASEIEEEEIPFEVPENWCWCRIDDLFAHNSGKALNKSENKVGTELEYITTSNLYWNYFELDNLKTMLFKDEEIEKCTVKKGDLLVCEGGEVGRSAIWNYDRTVCIQNHIHRLRAYDSKLNVLFYYHVMYLFKESKVIDNYAKGIGIKGLSSNALGSIIVPLPPLEEQEEIVKKMEELLPLCK